jgi:hypothetical protein
MNERERIKNLLKELKKVREEIRDLDLDNIDNYSQLLMLIQSKQSIIRDLTYETT